MGRPAYTVEVGFAAAGPLVQWSGISWTDITAYVRGVDTQRGRNHEMERTEPGTASVRLRNVDRRFDPLYSGGPYYGSLVPMKPLRITVTVGGTPYRVFAGFVTNWGQAWGGRPLAGQGDAEVTISAVDRLGVLGLYQVVTQYEDILSDDPPFYVPLTTDALDIGSLGYVATSVTAVAGGATGPVYGGKPSYDFTPSQKVQFTPDAGDMTVARAKGDLTVECWIYSDNVTASNYTVASAVYKSLSCWQFIRNGTTLYWYGSVASPLVTYTMAASTWYHVAGVRSGTESILYINGVEVGRTTGVASYIGTFTSNLVTIGANSSGLQGWDGRITHFAVWDRALPADRILSHARHSLGVQAAALTGSYIEGILQTVGILSSDYSLDTGVSPMQERVPSGSALDVLLQAAEDSEGGALFVDRSGTIQFIDRGKLYTDYRTTAGTFGDAGGAEVPYADMSVRYDEADISNIVRFGRENGIPQEVLDTASQTAYGPRMLERTGLLSSSDNDMLAFAQYYLARYKAPSWRVEWMDLQAGDNADARAVHMASRELHERVTVGRTPPGGGTAISQDCYVEGISHSMTDAGWSTRWQLVPVEASPAKFWILGTAGYGELGDVTYLHY